MTSGAALVLARRGAAPSLSQSDLFALPERENATSAAHLLGKDAGRLRWPGPFSISPGASGSRSRALGRRPPKPPPSASNAVTERERRVMALWALDQSNKEVARSLTASTETMKTHLKNILAKLDVPQRWQAAELARSLGLLEKR